MHHDTILHFFTFLLVVHFSISFQQLKDCCFFNVISAFSMLQSEKVTENLARSQNNMSQTVRSPGTPADPPISADVSLSKMLQAYCDT